MAYTPNRSGIKELSQRFPFYNRTMMTDDIVNDILGFDNAMTPWVPASIPGGAGSWSTSIGAGATMDTTTIPHFMYLFSHNGAVTYLQWTNAAAKMNVYANVGIGLRAGAGDGLVFEIRCWEAQAPVAATKYVAARWWQDRAGSGQHPLRFSWWYGTGVTFTAGDGAILVANGIIDWAKGAQFNCWLTALAGPAFYGMNSLSEGSPGYDGTLASAALPASFKTVWFYIPANRYERIVLDDIQVV